MFLDAVFTSPQRCRKFLFRCGLKSIFQSGLASVAEALIVEAKRCSLKKVFHERLQIPVYLKSVDIADLPID